MVEKDKLVELKRMLLKPENIEKKLKLFREILEAKKRVKEKENDVRTGLMRFLLTHGFDECETESIMYAITDIVDAGEELTEENIIKRAVEEGKEWYYLDPKRFEEKLRSLGEGEWHAIRFLAKKYREIVKRAEELERRAYKIFDIEPQKELVDRRAVEVVVRIVKKCLEYAMEE